MRLFRSAAEKQQSAKVEAAFREVIGELRSGDPEHTLQSDGDGYASE
jgi:hypothetical protein